MFTDVRDQFRILNTTGLFVMPNPWDVGSAKLLEARGFRALATTSGGQAASMGKHDQHVTRDELVAHVAEITAAVGVPVNADSERLFADTVDDIAITVGMLADAGASGCSIEDYDPATGAIDELRLATERVAAAAEAAHRSGITLTARAEAHLYGEAALDETIDRLIAFRGAGADVVYAPGLTDIDEITKLVQAVGAPVNILALPSGPSVAQLEVAGVRRVSTGSALAWAAYGALMRAVDELLDDGTSNYARNGLSRAHRHAFD